MPWYKLTDNSTGAAQFVASLDGIDMSGLTSTEVAEPTERDSETAHLDAAGVEAYALDLIEQGADNVSAAQFKQLRRHIMTVELWGEVQRLKLSNPTGNFTTLTAAEKALQFPILAALAQQSGNSIAAVATAVQNRLQARIQAIAVAEAKMLLGRDAVRAATTPADKLAAADAIQW